MQSILAPVCMKLRVLAHLNFYEMVLEVLPVTIVMMMTCVWHRVSLLPSVVSRWACWYGLACFLFLLQNIKQKALLWEISNRQGNKNYIALVIVSFS